MPSNKNNNKPKIFQKKSDKVKSKLQDEVLEEDDSLYKDDSLGKADSLHKLTSKPSGNKKNIRTSDRISERQAEFSRRRQDSTQEPATELRVDNDSPTLLRSPHVLRSPPVLGSPPVGLPRSSPILRFPADLNIENEDTESSAMRSSGVSSDTYDHAEQMVALPQVYTFIGKISKLM